MDQGTPNPDNQGNTCKKHHHRSSKDLNSDQEGNMALERFNKASKEANDEKQFEASRNILDKFKNALKGKVSNSMAATQ